MNTTTAQIRSRASSLPGFCPVQNAVAQMAMASVDERGAIFTRLEVVEFILDLVGYSTDRQLHKLRLLEPSFGGGDFLLPAIDRLLEAWAAAGRPDPLSSLRTAICGVELHADSYKDTKLLVAHRLTQAGIASEDAHQLANQWLLKGDFLLADLPEPFDVVIGNPPYVRQELIPDALMAEYRARYSTIFDRADIYVPFIERSLAVLKRGGECGFICSDRWMKNRYGGPLRRFVSDGFHLKIFVDMVGTPAFNTDVVAYPAITVISRDRGRDTRVAHRPEIEPATLAKLAEELTSASPRADNGVTVLDGVTSDAAPWLLHASDQLALVRRIEALFPLIEEAGCSVGIGVATGADKAFIGPFDELDVEASRKLPLAMTRDIITGEVEWRGFGVVNPFGDDGKLVQLEEFPKLKAYLEARREMIAGRHVAQKAPARWFRTIDRIYPELARREKLLIPDIKGEAQIVYEGGTLYPHHNLYFITSNEWDVRALQSVLSSGVARLFVATYSTKMRGGFLRFQAQYLRRIRLPRWSEVPHKLRVELRTAAINRDREACDRAVTELYHLSHSDLQLLKG